VKVSRLLFLSFFFSVSLAQLEVAEETILVMTQGVVEQPLEQALKDAARKRGVDVFILCPPDLVQLPASYIPNLSLIDGIYVRLIDHDESFVVIDGKRLINGKLEPIAGDAELLYSYFLGEWERVENSTYVYTPIVTNP
jgi:hypothetical protein